MVDTEDGLELMVFKNKKCRDQFWDENKFEDDDDMAKGSLFGDKITLEECKASAPGGDGSIEICFCEKTKNKPVVQQWDLTEYKGTNRRPRVAKSTSSVRSNPVQTCMAEID